MPVARENAPYAFPHFVGGTPLLPTRVHITHRGYQRYHQQRTIVPEVGYNEIHVVDMKHRIEFERGRYMPSSGGAKEMEKHRGRVL